MLQPPITFQQRELIHRTAWWSRICSWSSLPVLGSNPKQGYLEVSHILFNGIYFQKSVLQITLETWMGFQCPNTILLSRSLLSPNNNTGFLSTPSVVPWLIHYCSTNPKKGTWYLVSREGMELNRILDYEIIGLFYACKHIIWLLSLLRDSSSLLCLSYSTINAIIPY